MDIREVTDDEKRIFMDKAKDFFTHIRDVVNTLEVDIKSDDLKVQAAAVWITGNLCNWFNDFMNEVRLIHKQKDDLQKQIMDVSNESSTLEKIVS